MEDILSSLPFLGRNGRNPKMLQNHHPNLDLSFSNLTNINIFFIIFIHMYFKKIKIGYSPHICWFATNLWGQMEETNIDLF